MSCKGNLRGSIAKAVARCGEGAKLLDLISCDDGTYQATVMAKEPDAAKLAAVTAHMEIFHAVNPTGTVKLHSTEEVAVTQTSETCCYAGLVCSETGELLRFL